MALGCWGSAWNSPLIHYRCRVADCKHFRIARHRRCCHSLPPWCRRAEKLTAANALRAPGQVFLMREKAVASMSKFDFLISPTSPITAYAVDEATSGNDDWKPILRYRMSSTKSNPG
jgi:Asp-tRNA(Asn)/Glu-tRNA(Gln) amidotransferase A subunit family amidase